MALLAQVGRLFPRNPAIDTVRTVTHLSASPEDVYRKMLFYEEVPAQPNSLLRMLLPMPVRTRGDKKTPGSKVECMYDDGYLEKVIRVVDPGRRVHFDVIEQKLGIEASVSMIGGSYELDPDGNGTRITLSTSYHGHLRPRWLWRPLEHYLAHRVHRHILDGMRVVLEAVTLPPSSAAVAELALFTGSGTAGIESSPVEKPFS
jgi:hypothetical protein